MKVLKGILAVIDKINEFAAKFSAWIMVILILALCYEVMLRYGLGKPTLWAYDVSWFLSSFVIMLGMGHTFRVKGHVSIDIFYQRFPDRVKALFDVFFALILFFPLMFVILRNMFPHLVYSWSTQERAVWSVWLPVVYPFKTWVTLGVVLLVIQGIGEFLRDLKVLIVGGERP